MNEIRIQPAQPTQEYARAFAELANMANDQLFKNMLGRRWLAVLTAMYLAPHNDNSHQYVHFAIVSDAQIAGMMCGYSGAQKRADARHTAFLYLRHALWQAPRVLLYLIAMGVLMRFMDHVPPRTYYIALTAVYAEYRQNGIATALLDCATTHAQRANCDRLALDVSIHNIAAISAARRYGFTIEKSSPVIEYNNRPSQGVHRMIKPL